MKRSELFFSFLLVPLDFAMIVLAGISAYNLRFAQIATEIRPVIFNLRFGDYIQILLGIAIAWLFIFAFAGLYRIRGNKSLVNEFYSIVQASSTGLVLIVLLIFFFRELFSSRFIVLAGYVLAMLYILIARLIVRLIQRILYNHNIGVRKVVIVGNGKTADILIAYFSSRKVAGYEVFKRLRDFSLETAQELAKMLETKEADEIIQCDPNLSKAEVVRLFDFAYEHHLSFKYAADLLDAKVLKTEVTEVVGIPIVEVERTSLEGWGRIIKRIFDIIGSSLIIIIISPILLVTAMLIKLDSRGPVFFNKRDDGTPVYRVGQGGRLFKYFKFRSMRPGTDNMRYAELAGQNLRSDGPMVKIKDDPRVTRVGRFIRRFSIDELAELFLVLKGDMSLVGPRPHLPEEVAKYEQSHKKVLTIKPGITGLAQVSGRSDLTFEEEVKLDTYYIENWSLLLDLSIMLQTPMAVLKNRQAE
ncbi:MAG: sugar transferase [Candidatus Falkowbacteria bacterium]